jgi:hypothetical protein
MTHEAQTGRLPRETVAPPAEAAEPPDSFATADLLEGLWGLLTSMKFGVVVILALAALGLVGTMVIQAPPVIASDAGARLHVVSDPG